MPAARKRRRSESSCTTQEQTTKRRRQSAMSASNVTLRDSSELESWWRKGYCAGSYMSTGLQGLSLDFHTSRNNVFAVRFRRADGKQQIVNNLTAAEAWAFWRDKFPAKRRRLKFASQFTNKKHATKLTKEPTAKQLYVENMTKSLVREWRLEIDGDKEQSEDQSEGESDADLTLTSDCKSTESPLPPRFETSAARSKLPMAAVLMSNASMSSQMSSSALQPLPESTASGFSQYPLTASGGSEVRRQLLASESLSTSAPVIAHTSVAAAVTPASDAPMAVEIQDYKFIAGDNGRHTISFILKCNGCSTLKESNSQLEARCQQLEANFIASQKLVAEFSGALTASASLRRRSEERLCESQESYNQMEDDYAKLKKNKNVQNVLALQKEVKDLKAELRNERRRTKRAYAMYEAQKTKVADLRKA